MSASSFASEVEYLRAHGDVIVLEGAGGARVAVSPKYQGRVMTSGYADDGPSFGWVNHAFIDKGASGTAFDNYGGEDRFWLGPEAGQFGLYFAPGKPFTFGEWQTPHSMQEGAWKVQRQTKDSVTFTAKIDAVNWSGTTFSVAVERTVRMVSGLSAQEPWLPADAKGKVVAFETVNSITNLGPKPWTRETGLVSIWILGMFNPAEDARIVVPLVAPAGNDGINDRYFGKVPSDRLRVRNDASCVILKADGKYRSKIGVAPSKTDGRAFAYSASTGVLTMARAIPAPDPSKPYVNSLWEKQDAPYGGDALNAYNDGPTEPGKPSLGGFYELETSSPAAELKPGESLTHAQRTVHAVIGDATRAGGLPVATACLTE